MSPCPVSGLGTRSLLGTLHPLPLGLAACASGGRVTKPSNGVGCADGGTSVEHSFSGHKGSGAAGGPAWGPSGCVVCELDGVGGCSCGGSPAECRCSAQGAIAAPQACLGRHHWRPAVAKATTSFPVRLQVSQMAPPRYALSELVIPGPHRMGPPGGRLGGWRPRLAATLGIRKFKM